MWDFEIPVDCEIVDGIDRAPDSSWFCFDVYSVCKRCRK